MFEVWFGMDLGVFGRFWAFLVISCNIVITNVFGLGCYGSILVH